MPTKLESWERPHYAPTNAEAFLYYTVFSKVNLDASVSRSAYRTDGLPDGLEAQRFNREPHGDFPIDIKNGYLWRQLCQERPSLAEDVEASSSCLLISGSLPDSPTLDYLRDTVGVLTHFADQDATAIFDPQSFNWWSPVDWRRRVFEPARPVWNEHVVILVSDEASTGRLWFHTRGLRKFARPDISVRGVGHSRKEAVTEMCNRFIEHQVFGLVVPEGQEIQMNGLPDGGRVHHAGDFDDPDFNNVHIEIVWPGGALDDRQMD